METLEGQLSGEQSGLADVGQGQAQSLLLSNGAGTRGVEGERDEAKAHALLHLASHIPHQLGWVQNYVHVPR